ncbi:MAG: radical SAM protein, partial [bacterium]|nr:radical SAM protein [bacterium]
MKKAPYIDKIVVGEGQYLFLKILRGELPANQRVFTLEDIDKKTLGYSQLNVPDMTDFDVKSEYPYLSAQGSSSCPMKCSFCNVSVFYGEYKEKPAQQLIREMTNLYEKYGVQLFFMNDSLLNFTASAIAEEFKKSPISLYWDGYMRVGPEPSDRENTILWRKGGLYRVRLGVESGSQFVLDAMQKKITPQQTKDTLFALAGAGIKTTTYWVIGHPGETEEDFLKTLDLLEETKNDIYEAECNPFFMGFNGQPNTEVWKDTRVQIYPEEDLDMLIIQTWKSDCYPSKAEAYERVNRFVQRCDELGIPNPYSVEDIYQADERWKQLHPNAVPPLVGFLNAETYVEECKDVVNLVYARKKK